MATSPVKSFPKQLFVAIEQEGGNDQYFSAEESEKHFKYDDEGIRTFGVYELKRVIECEATLTTKEVKK